MMMVTCIKQHLSNIINENHEKIKVAGTDMRYFARSKFCLQEKF